MDIRRSNVAEMRAIATTLFDANEDEVVGKVRPPLEIDWPRYQLLEEGGALPILAAWSVEFAQQQLVGYSVSVIVPHLHYHHRLECHNDVVYIAENARQSTAIFSLLRATEDAAAAAGASRMLWHVPPGSPLDLLMRRYLGHADSRYRHLETTYAREF